MSLLGFLLPRPFAGRGLDGVDYVVGNVVRARRLERLFHFGCSALSVRMIEDLPRSANWMWAEARCRAQITGSPALARTCASVLSSPSPVEPKVRNGLLMQTLQLAPVTISLWTTLAPCV